MLFRSLIAEIEKVMDCVSICPPRLGQEAALYGLKHLLPWARRNTEGLKARADLLGGVEMFCADFTTQRFSRHWHPGYALGVVTRGAERLYCRTEHHVAGTGELIAVNPGEIHDGEPAEAGGWAYRMLYPSEQLVREIWSDLAGGRGTPRFCQSVIADGEAARQLVNAHRAAETAGDRLQAESALVLALSALLARHAEPEGGRRRPTMGVDRHRLRPALELIEADVARPLSLD